MKLNFKVIGVLIFVCLFWIAVYYVADAVCGCAKESVYSIEEIGTVHIWDEDCEREIVTNSIPNTYIICNECGEVYLLDKSGLPSKPSPTKVLELVKRERKRDKQDRDYIKARYGLEDEPCTDYDKIENKARMRLLEVQIEDYRRKGYKAKRITDIVSPDLSIKNCWWIYKEYPIDISDIGSGATIIGMDDGALVYYEKELVHEQEVEIVEPNP